MLDFLKTILLRECRIDTHQSVLLGVSGGPDSICLLDILHRLGYPLVVAHLDHGLRPEGRDDALFVRGVAESLGVPVALGATNARAHAEDQALSIEDAAREVRYRFLFEQAEAYGCQAVAVAHNADDQVETVLMHLLRGSGLDGLTGMPYRALPNPWHAHIPLVRPLLGVWREEIEACCDERGLDFVIDHTNLDTTYFRNRLRHELIPQLETYIPGVRKRLWQTADLLAADRHLLSQLTGLFWGNTIETSGTGYICFDPEKLLAHALGLQRRLVRRAIAQLRPEGRNIDFAMVGRILDFAADPALQGPIDLGLGLCVFREEGLVYLAAWSADLPTAHWPQITHRASPASSNHQPPTLIDLGNGWQLRAETLAGSAEILEAALRNDDPYRAWIDIGERQPTLNVRARRPGDRFQPLGMGGKSMKLSDFMINVKIPQRARAAWPLVCLGEEIAWVPGYRLAYPFRLTGESNHILKLELTRQGF